MLAGVWRLVELDGAPVPADDDERVPEIAFDAEARRISGSGGCNRLTGSFEESGTDLAFGPVATTRMACSDAVVERERAFLRALETTTGYALAEGQLLLLAEVTVVARLEASDGAAAT